MTLTQVIKKNKLLLIVGMIYLILFILMPDKASKAMSNSVYYLIEMFQILPVIFLLTVVIEALIPKEVIIKHFGEKSGFLGNILSLVLGSISAGPIYAAFPISKMLLSKGASVANIVIILSSWAVIKVPMLANEVKFLGFSFMGVRWILTVIAILSMAWITGKLVDRKELAIESANTSDVLIEIKKEYCIGCGICVKMLPEVYEINEQKAQVKTQGINLSIKEIVLDTVEKCPTNAIVFHEI
ncbi:MAG: permease [Firmicutes bacterium HGW-Firmicutes-1]|jgi:uncharacterized membrane protein YraQ (UPF0718 family)|nr:MAG: permease [Firmicutes bacterium HGW-Firmicutes-1]